MTGPGKSLPFALYDAFTAVPFKGSQAGIVLGAGGLDAGQRQTIAAELGYAATGFVEAIDGHEVKVRFHSTRQEYGMCGHGTVCLFTYLIDEGLVAFSGSGAFRLHVDGRVSDVDVTTGTDGRAVVMLEVKPGRVEDVALDIGDLFSALGGDATRLCADLPIQKVAGDFRHLAIPFASLAAVSALEPDFANLRTFCLAHDIDTVACFSRETCSPTASLHARDFCPAVGVNESAGAGTTSAALAVYLHEHGALHAGNLKIEQGAALGREAVVVVRAVIDDKTVQQLHVGGVASKVICGQLTAI